MERVLDSEEFVRRLEHGLAMGEDIGTAVLSNHQEEISQILEKAT